MITRSTKFNDVSRTKATVDSPHKVKETELVRKVINSVFGPISVCKIWNGYLCLNSVVYPLLNTRFKIQNYKSSLSSTDISPTEVAVNALLDRAYGKPAVKEEKELVDLPPVVIQLTNDQ